MEIRECLNRETDRLGLGLSDDLLRRLADFDDLLQRWNRRINLTRLLSTAERARWLYGESFWGARLCRPGVSLADIGAGAGFPGFSFKLLDPTLELLLVEARARKAHFLKEAAAVLGLTGVQVVEARAEAWLGDRPVVLRNYSWRAIRLGPALLSTLLRRLPEGGTLITFAAPGAEELEWLERDERCRRQLQEVVPGSQNRVVAQFVKCST